VPIREQIILEGVNKTQPLERGIDSLNRKLGAATKAAGAFVIALAAREVIQFGKRIVDTASKFQQYNNQLKLITKGQEDLERVFGLLTKAAVDNRTSFEETLDLFVKLRVSTEALGIAEERVINVTGKLSKALQLAGADGNTAASVIRQFGQAMASGEVRGDEFRSLVEGMGPALSIMARESGITVGELRKMSRAGELTAQRMFEMLESSNSLENAFQSMRPTIGQMETELGDAFDRAIVKTGEATGLTNLYQQAIEGLTDLFNKMAGQEDPFETMTLSQLGQVESIKDLESALEELNDRYLKLLDLGPITALTNFLKDGQTVSEAIELMNATKALIPVLEKRLEIARAQAEEDKAAFKAQEELNKSIQDALRPYGETIDKIEQYKKLDFGSTLDKLRAKQDDAAKSIEKIKEAQQKLLEVTDKNNSEYQKLEEGLKHATKAYEGYGAQITEIEKKQADDAVKAQIKSIQENIARLKEHLAEKQQRYEAYANMLGEVFNDTTKQLEIEYNNRQKIIDDALDSGLISQKRAAELEKALNKKKLEDIEKAERASREKRRLEDFKSKGLTEQQAEDLNENIKLFEKDKGKFIIKNTGDILESLGTFNKKAFEAYKAYSIAEALVNTYKGAAAAIGSGLPPPFNFVAAAAVVAAGMAQVNAIRSQQFQGRRFGGPVTRDQPYIVGEAGPELFVPQSSGSIASNSTLGGKAVTVNFNIDTTDARGFDQLLVERRNVLVNIINDAVTDHGREAII
jgi:tape measure domain-containing protein